MSSSFPAPAIRAESLGQIYTRLVSSVRPVLQRIVPPELIPEDAHANGDDEQTPRQLKLHGGQTIEITGLSNTGKTHMLMELMVRTVVLSDTDPDTADDHTATADEDQQVLFIDTEHQLDVFKLSAALEYRITTNSTSAAAAHRKLHHEQHQNTTIEAPTAEQIADNVDDCLRRIHIVHCHSPEHLDLAVLDLDARLRAAAGRIALLALDSVATYYWLKEHIEPSGVADDDGTHVRTSTTASSPSSSSTHHQQRRLRLRPIRQSTHVRQLVDRLRPIVKRHGAVLAFVRTAEFGGQTATAASAASRKRRYSEGYDANEQQAPDDEENCSSTTVAVVRRQTKGPVNPGLADISIHLEHCCSASTTVPAANEETMFQASLTMHDASRCIAKQQGSSLFAIDDFGIHWRGFQK